MMKYQFEKVNSWHFETNDDPIGYIVTTHLFVEHGLNYLIFKNCKNYKKILDDTRTFTFSVKLQLCYEMKLIPQSLYENILTLNSLRNKMVHNLDVDFKALKMFFTSISGEKMFPIGDFVSDNNDKNEITVMIMNVGLKTITPLNSLIMLKYLNNKN